MKPTDAVDRKAPIRPTGIAFQEDPALSPDAVIVSLAGDGRFHFITAPSGGAQIEGAAFTESLATGQSLLLPAAIDTCTAKLEPGTVLLDMFVEI